MEEDDEDVTTTTSPPDERRVAPIRVVNIEIYYFS